jgi:hypothetical protein
VLGVVIGVFSCGSSLRSRLLITVSVEPGPRCETR